MYRRVTLWKICGEYKDATEEAKVSLKKEVSILKGDLAWLRLICKRDKRLI